MQKTYVYMHLAAQVRRSSYDFDSQSPSYVSLLIAKVIKMKRGSYAILSTELSVHN